MNTSRRFFAIASAFLSVAVASEARAQSDYPNKPVRIVVDSAAGSANDATSRIIADKLSRMWNQQVLTLNQPGAGGGISAKVASQSPGDGYTLYMPATSPFLALPGAPGVAPNLPIELPRDFVAISLVLEQPLYIGASHKSGINTIADVIRMAKEKPGEVSYAATGRGRLTHLTMELRSPHRHQAAAHPTPAVPRKP
jgi:tripartite-type tricarboxylate transporter receptor subunit TctC